MSVSRSGVSRQSWATLATSGGWGRTAAFQDERGGRGACPGKPSSSNSGSTRASARAGPEPSAKKASLPLPVGKRASRAYWQARQATTRIGRAHHQRPGPAWRRCARKRASRFPARPCRFQRGANPRRCCRAERLPASISVSPSSPRATATLSSAAAAFDPLDELRRALVHAECLRAAHGSLPLVLARIAAPRCAATLPRARSRWPRRQSPCTKDRHCRQRCRRLAGRPPSRRPIERRKRRDIAVGIDDDRRPRLLVARPCRRQQLLGRPRCASRTAIHRSARKCRASLPASD